MLPPPAARMLQNMPSYPVAWWEADEPTHVGRLDVHPGHLALEGRRRDGASAGELSLSYDELVTMRIVRNPAERLDGLPGLVVTRSAGPPVSLVSLAGLGTLNEIAESLGRELAARRSTHEPLELVIAGGGVGGIEAMLALTALAPRLVRITLLSATPTFAYRPLAVMEPFGLGEGHVFDLESIAADCGATLRLGSLASVDAGRRLAVTADGEALPFDVLLLAAGARAENVLPGAVAFAGGAERDAFRSVLADLEEGRARRVVFAVPGGVSWPLPLYELALLTAAHLAERGVADAELVLVTPEPSALSVFEAEGADAVAARLAERGIRLVTGTYPSAFEGGALRVLGGDPIPADHVVSMPRLAGPRFAGLPHDECGFVPVDRYMHAAGLADVYAVGDATAFPVKQGGIAAQQADVAAEGIAARAGAPVRPTSFRPVLRGLMLTGDAPLFLRTELGGGRGQTSTASSEQLWQPGAKIAGRYLGAYLAERTAAAA